MVVKFTNKEREKYQQECIDKNSKNNGRGQNIFPTGAGKTRMGIGIIAKRLCQSPIATVNAVLTHRLLLTKQWVQESLKLLPQGIKIGFINVNSGGIPNEVKEILEKTLMRLNGGGVPKTLTTTNPEKFKEQVQVLKDSNIHCLVFCTYHSSWVLKESEVKFHTIICDEAHALVTRNENKNGFRDTLDIKTENMTFFTATKRTTDSDDGLGMNNEAIFGKTICQKSPLDILKTGAIILPDWEIMYDKNFRNIKDGDYNNKTDLVWQAFLNHKKNVKKVSAFPNKIGAKLLVRCDGQLTLNAIFESREFKEKCNKYPSVKIYGLCSDFGVYINGIKYDPPVSNYYKEKLLAELGKLEDNDDCIIFHVDMISEGLDVPGMTGFLPLRNCEKEKALHNIGRCTRLHPYDAKRIESGELKIGDYKNYVKPNCFVVIPYCMDNREDYTKRYHGIIDGMKEEYNYDSSSLVNIDNLKPGQTNDEWEEDELEREVRSLFHEDRLKYLSICESNKTKIYFKNMGQKEIMQYLKNEFKK